MAWVAVGATAIGAAGSYLSSKNAPKMPKPTKSDYAGQVNKLLGTYESTMPGVKAFEAGARPGLMGLNLADQATYLQGIGGQLGYIGQAGLAQQQAQQQIQQSRAGEYGAMTGQTGAVRGLLGAISPEAQRMMQLQQQAAETAYGAAGGLTGQEQRGAQQAAREASMARGNIGGNASIASEVLNREDILARKRAEASQAGQTAYQSAQNFYSPAMNLLSMTPADIELGSKYAATGAGMIGQATPQLFDYNTAFGMEQQRMGSQDQYNQARYQQKLQNTQNNMAMWSKLGGIGSTIAGSPTAMSNLGGLFGGNSGGGYMQGIGGNQMAAAKSSGAY
jgi:hypothetical protein